MGSPDKSNWQRHNLQEMRILEFYCQIMQTFPERARHSRSDNWLTINTGKEQHRSLSCPFYLIPPWVSAVEKPLGPLQGMSASGKRGGQGLGVREGGPCLFRPLEEFIPVAWLPKLCWKCQNHEGLQKYLSWTQVR